MPNRVDPDVQPDEQAAAAAPVDRLRAEPQSSQLRVSDHPVLAARELGNPPVDGLWALSISVCVIERAHSAKVPAEALCVGDGRDDWRASYS